MSDRLSDAWERLLNLFLGRKAVKTIDACARYWGTVVKVTGSKVDVRLDSPDIAGPSNVPLYLGLPGCTVSNIEGMRVLVGFRNGDPTQPYADDFEQGTATPMITIGQTSPLAAMRVGDTVAADTTMAAWIAAVTAKFNAAAGPMLSAPASITPPVDFGKGSSGSGNIKIGL